MTEDSITRRQFIALVSCAAAWSFAARAQQPGARIARIGIIGDTPLWGQFRQELRHLGYIEGRNIGFEYRVADGKPDRLAAAAIELARLPVNVIATYGTAPTQAAMQATSTIPIIMVGIGDPVGADLVASLARPGGDVTGNTVLSADIIAKRLQLLREVIPTVTRVALLLNPDNASHAAVLTEARSAAPGLGMALIPVEVRSIAEFDTAFVAMMRERPDAFIMTNDPFHQLHLARIVEFLAKNRLPALFQTREHVVAGGLMSYGASLPDLFRRAAGYVHKILQGTKPADLPVEEPTKFELVINLKTAKALGLRVPELFLLRVDEVIE